MRLVVAHLARRDVQAIARHSEWGAARKAQYMAAIREKFRFCSGGRQSALRATISRPAIVAIPWGRHLIFYRVEEGSVIILRVLHQRMDVRLHF
jgi:toxin ParE1/3/4